MHRHTLDELDSRRHLISQAGTCQGHELPS